ncbi:MAG: 30S ribosomal protein S20 [Acidobacteria bacterium]|nr:30S ribosomal protein S20 [Acidobacteriota bacterium]
MATTISAKRKRRSRSVLKRIRQAERRQAINRANKSRLRTQIKRFGQAVAAGNLSQAREFLGATLSAIDRSIHKRILHANTTSRTKSRLMLRYNALLKQQATTASR